jgi:hypothetical protein
MQGRQVGPEISTDPLSLWERVRVRAGFQSPLSRRERVRVRAGFQSPLSRRERVRVRAGGRGIRD